MINIDGQCTNCAMKFISASQIFTSITVVDEMICSKTRDIPILDAILHIYGFSAPDLAGVYLHDDKSSGVNGLLETSDYIAKNGLSLCCSCVSVFKEVYVAHHQFKKLSTEAALLPKAIKKYSPSSVKVEVDPEEKDCNNEIENPENNTNKIQKPRINVVRLRKIPPERKETLTVETEAMLSEDAFQHFQFDENDEEYFDNEDVKVDPFQDVETASEFITGDVLPSSSTFLSVFPNAKNTESCNFDNGIGPCRSCSPSCNKTVNASSPHENAQLSSNGRYNTRRKASILPSVDTFPKVLKSKKTTIRKLNVDPTGQPLTKMQMQMAKLRRTKRLGCRRKNKKKSSTIQKVEVYKKSVAEIKLKNKNDAAKSSKDCSKKEVSVSTEEYPEEERNEYYWDIIFPTLKKQSDNSLEEESVSKKLVQCSCGKYLNSFGALRSHEQRRHISDSIISTCDTCGKHFTKLYLLYKHKFLEHSQGDEISIDCKLCDAKFLYSWSLKDHVEEHHSDNLHSFVCAKCGSRFNSLRRLKVHNKIHKDEGLNKEFKCKECGVVMKHEMGLKKHMRVMHTYMKTFSCPKCGKTTKNMTNMRIHMKVHDPHRMLKRQPPNETQEKAPN